MDAKTQVAGSAGDSAYAGMWCSEVRSVLGTGLDRALVSYRYPVTVCCDVGRSAPESERLRDGSKIRLGVSGLGEN